MDWIREASTAAGKADAVFFATLLLATLFLVFITALMVGFVLRYGRDRHPRAAQIEGNLPLEITWTVIPLVLFLVIFYYGWTRFEYSRNPPRDAMAVRVTARQWKWGFTYPNGKQTAVLYAPVDRPMKLELVSTDVIHGFFVPAFRLKLDAVPSFTNSTWFQATRTGTFDILCTVICGVDHSGMLGKVVVVPEAEFRAWYFAPEGALEPVLPGAPAAPAAEPAGLALLRTKGCLDCHSVDGSPMVGPTLKGVYGRKEEVQLAGQVRRLTVDEARLRRAILAPGKEVVQGYPPVMPQVELAPRELDQVIDYLKTLD
jgi:cytochrome c oxidase subunit 2